MSFMRAVRIDRFGGPEVLRLTDVPAPEPNDGEVLVAVTATSINPVDDKTRQGAIGEGTPRLPMTLGWELAGTVVDGGSSRWRRGEPVIAMSHQLGTACGTWAEMVALSADSLAPAPTKAEPVQAATLPLPGLTALQTLDWLAPSAGQRLLVTGAAGAVGGLAVQLARARGIRVDALVSRTSHLALVRELGARLATTDRAALPERAYDAVLDTFGAFVTGAVADGGRYASIATQAGPVPDLSARDVRTTVHQVREDGAGLQALSRLVDQGGLRLRVDSTFDMRDIQAAHRRFTQTGLRGKVTMTF